MQTVYLLLGSNVGDRMDYLKKASISIESKIGKIVKKSQVYETEPWGEKEQDDFLNIVLEIQTKLNPTNTLEKIKEIESLLEREETYKWGPREIDIDILFFGDEMISEVNLTIPHPFIHERKFTLVPLSEIAPDLYHPFMGTTVVELLLECEDMSDVKPFKNLN
jgi:2-amino-4-hydroxy-6-hydroxymethyldihydropteridine diphosphokinase